MISVKNVVFGIVIFLLTLFVGIYGINTFYGKGPEYSDFCKDVFNEGNCSSVGGNWINNTVLAEGKSIPAGRGYCEYDYIICQKNYDSADKTYWRGFSLLFCH